MGEAEEYLNRIPMWTRTKNSLADVRTFLSALDNPDRAVPAIHVAGTNGKGSVCAFLTSVLMAAGYRTGTFISPHLVSVRERFLIDGSPVTEAHFEKSFQRVREATAQMMERGLLHPTFFEFLFYMAMELFRLEQVDVMVIETGLGGRLDTTNVLEKPLCAVITSISLDHTKYLGDTTLKIAGEKAGIIKPGAPLIYDDTGPEAAQVLRAAARKAGVQAVGVNQTDYDLKEILADNMFLTAHMRDGKQLLLQVPFEALYQAENAMVAVRALELLREQGSISFSDENLFQGIKNTHWAGRMEHVGENVYLDGAHNPGGIQAFLQTAREICRRRSKGACLLFAAVSDKDYEKMIEQLCQGLPWAGIGVVHMKSDRGLSAGVLAGRFQALADCPVRSYENTSEALADMLRLAEDRLLFCAGSLYLIGELKALFTAGHAGDSSSKRVLTGVKRNLK